MKAIIIISNDDDVDEETIVMRWNRLELKYLHKYHFFDVLIYCKIWKWLMIRHICAQRWKWNQTAIHDSINHIFIICIQFVFCRLAAFECCFERHEHFVFLDYNDRCFNLQMAQRIWKQLENKAVNGFLPFFLSFN